ncbi:MAG: leuA 2 [Cohnella sp.]|nr:leuA 2 [Cohnella sp.]
MDAIYQAIDALTGETVELDDYTIKSVTDGTDALGEVHVLLKQGDLTAQGRGVSTDILEARPALMWMRSTGLSTSGKARHAAGATTSH